MDGFSPATPQKSCHWLNATSCTDMTLVCASIHRRAGLWPKEKAAGVVTLDFEARHRRRTRLTTDQGEDVLLHLPKAVAMADGDGLQLEDRRWLKIQAAAELVIEIRHRDPNQLVRLAWHLGNRHLPIEFRNQALRIQPDHVIEDMLYGFGAELAKVQAPFQPEGGAYSSHSHPQNHNDGAHFHE